MLKDNAIYGIELISADGSQPGVFLTFTGKEAKELVKLLNKHANRSLNRVVEGETQQGGQTPLKSNPRAF